MLKRIERLQVRLGMFIVRLEGDWLHHPFWKREFLITDPADLAKLHASQIASVMIDDSKGVAQGKAPSASSLDQVLAENAPVDRQLPLRHRQKDPESARMERTVQQCRRAVARMFTNARMGRGVELIHASSIVSEITASLDRNPSALLALTRLKSLDSYTYYHSIAVSALMVKFSRHLKRDAEEIQLIGMAGLLHDVGKMTIPRSILLKPGSLTPEEIALIRTHTLSGYHMLSVQPGIPDLILDVCLHHHERMDGEGYPCQLNGSQLSIHARVSAICDVYDAVTSIRPYRAAWEPVYALSKMLEWKDHFDQQLLREFIVCMGYGDDFPFPDSEDLSVTKKEFSENGYSDPSV